MGFLAAIERRNSLSLKDPALLEWFGLGAKSLSGTKVTEETALGVAAFWDGVRAISSAVGTLPRSIYERVSEGGRRQVIEHPLYFLLHNRPNPEMTAAAYFSAAQGQLLLRGNAYSEIELDNAGRVKGLWPLHPDRVEPLRYGPTNELIYRVTLPSGQQVNLPRSRVLHVRGFSPDGIIGWSVLKLHKETLGLNMAREQFGARFFGQGSQPIGALKSPHKLSPEAHTRMRTSWEELNSGMEQAHRVAIMEEGVEFTKIGVDPKDSQMLESSQFGIEEVARILNMPVHMLKQLGRTAGYNSNEQAFIEFVVMTLRPWFVIWEQQINSDLFPPSEQAAYYVEWNAEGLLRGDTAARGEFYNKMFLIGALSINEIREKENMNGIGAPGDEHYVQLNMMPVSSSPDATPPTARSIVVLPELRGIASRRRLMRAHRRLFHDAAERIVRRERADVMRAAEKMLQRSVTDFHDYLERFYRDHAAFVQRQMAPALLTFADTIQAEASSEIGADISIDGEMERFLRGYLDIFAARHINSSLNQIRRVLDENQDDPLAAVRTRFEQWEESRPGKIALRESVEASNAVTKEVYRRAGVRNFKWVAQGEICPTCRHLDGKVIAIDGKFAAKGKEIVTSVTDQTPIVPRTDITHGPIHSGCECTIAAA